MSFEMAKEVIHTKVDDLPFVATILRIYAPFVLSSLIAYSIGSHASLRLWIALQQAPIIHGAKPNEKFNWRIFFIVFALVAATLLIGVVATFTQWTYMVLGFPIFALPILLFLGTAFGCVPYSVHRTVDGGSTQRPIEELIKYRHLLVACSAVISAGALISSHFNATSPFTYIAFAAWVCGLSSNMSQNSAPFTVSATLYAIIAFVFTLLNILAPDASNAVMNSSFEKRDNGDYLNWTLYNSLWPAIFTALPGVILSILLRFDYQKHLEANPDANESRQLKGVMAPGAPLKTSKTVGPGIIVPTRAPRNFRKTYYHTALAGWALGQFLVIVSYLVCKTTDHAIPTINVMMHLTPAGVDIMLIFILVTSIVKGDFKKLAIYREAWKVKLPKQGTLVTAPVTVEEDGHNEGNAEIEEEKVALLA